MPQAATMYAGMRAFPEWRIIMETKTIKEKELKPKSGFMMLLFNLFLTIAFTALLVFGIVKAEAGDEIIGGIMIAGSMAGYVAAFIMFCGLCIVKPNEARVLTLFGNYYGTILKEGYYYVNPFSSKNKIVSLKTKTLNNEKQKVNDVMGNPIVIGSVVIWRVVNPTSATFNVENYEKFLSIQTDSTIRNIARIYPYDCVGDDDGDDANNEKTLRGSAQEIADSMKEELQKRVELAGIEIEEIRITHLSYSEEIAAAMLQRQQAAAIISARKKIVEGAVSMVKMAIDQLSDEEIVVLDEERKAAMVSNLLVVLCGNKDAQPVVNSGSIY